MLLLAVMLPALASAHDIEVDGIYYNVNGNNATVTYRGQYYSYSYEYFGAVNIPSSVTYGDTTYSVKGIGNSAFRDCSALTSVTIPNSVTEIGERAFMDCSGLTSVTIGSSVMTIGYSAFSGCRRLTNVTIPNSVTEIGELAFYGCSGLTSIEVANGNTKYDSRNNCNAIIETTSNMLIAGCQSTTIPNSVTSIGSYAFYGCSGLTSVDIPNSVTTIGNSAFYGCSGLTNVTIGNSVTTIGGSAFQGCSGLTSVTIPNSVNSIGNEAFQGCNALDTLNFNPVSCAISITTASLGPFYNLNISTINIGDNVEKIPSYLAYGLTKLANVTIPNSVTSIGSYAFCGCSGLTGELVIPSSVTSISRYSFYGCSGLSSLIIPNSIKTINYATFENCSGLTSVTFGSSVRAINENAFAGCSGLTRVDISNLANWCQINFGSATTNPLYYAQHLYLNESEVTDLVVPDDVDAIGDYAFYNCCLSSVILPQSVTSVGTQAFNNSPTIGAVTCEAAAPPAWDDIAMFTTNVYNHTPLYVPKGSESAYMADQCWGQFATIIGKEIQDDVLAASISLNRSQVSLQVGGTSQLIATVLPDSTTNKVVTWISSDSAVASVDGNGIVTALSIGIATITATTTDGSNLSASCVVTVTENLSDYDNYLSIDDIEVFHGDTIVVPVKMTNETSIISFQTDIFLPDGLELLQEDGEYLIDPSERMTRTHSIMSNDISNGSVRVICYSSNYKPFTGNSGDDLFYITVKVADNAEGIYTIQLKNTLLTTSDFVELIAPDVAANVNVKAYLLGDANNSGTVTVTDVVVTSQYVLELNPQPFVYEAADVNTDGNITVTDVSRIAWMVLNPAMNTPLRAPALLNIVDRMIGEDITFASGETRRVSIQLDNEMDYSAFQLDLQLPDGLTASNFQLTDRAGNHTFDVNTLQNGNIRALCYSPTMTSINGHEGALLTFDMTATGIVTGDILVDGIELVTTSCQTVKLDSFTMAVNSTTGMKELSTGKTIARVEYFNLAGQKIAQPESGVTLVVTTYTDGTRTTTKVMQK